MDGEEVYAAAREEYRKVIREKAEEIERLRAALTPSADTKAAYSGEFYVEDEIIDEEGEAKIIRIPLPWTVIKEIMTAIRARAALGGDK